MPQAKRPHKQDIVRTIFDRPSKNKPEGLFVQKGDSVTQEKQKESTTSVHVHIKNQYPFGLDIGEASIKIVQLGRDNKGSIKIINASIEEIPQMVRDDPNQKISYIPQALRKIVKEKELKGRCFTHIPSSLCKVNLIKLRRMPADEIEKALHWEVRQIFQVDLNETSIDHVVLEHQKKEFLEDSIGVLTVMVPKKEVLERLAMLESIGLSALAVDIEQLSGLEAFNYLHENAGLNQVMLFLDFGAGKTALSIICNRELVATRALNITGDYLTKAISSYCNISPEEAEGMKKDYGLSELGQGSDGLQGGNLKPDEKAVQVQNAILSHLENMVQDIEHTFKYFSYQVARSKITSFDKIVLSGGSSHLKGIIPFLRKRLGVSVETINLTDELCVPKQLSGEMRASSRMDVALGLALRGLKE